jgi:hypothetical protein
MIDRLAQVDAREFQKKDQTFPQGCWWNPALGQSQVSSTEIIPSLICLDRSSCRCGVLTADIDLTNRF